MRDMHSFPPLLDINGRFGEPAATAPEFPTLAGRLRHMDRLGIARSVVWNVEAIQHHALSANQGLLDEIERTPGAAQRIVPAMVISPLMPYEANGIARLREQLARGRTNALRFVTGFSNLTLPQCEPVVRAIEDLHPWIAVECSAIPVRDILDFAALFPKIPLVLANVMWPQAITAYDLMRRRPNIMLEISLVHTWDGIRHAAGHFGADRIVFGTGHATHNGAAIAALARAGISDADRVLIAHGNGDRLLGTPTPAGSTTPLRAGNLYWRRLLEGRPLETDIIDAHGHFGPSAGYVIDIHDEREQIPLALRAMDELGQSLMIVSGLQALLGSAPAGNALLEEVLRPHAKRLKGYLAFNPFFNDELIKSFDRFFAGDVFIGFKLLCDYWRVPVTDPRFNPMWEYAQQHRLPVLIHTWQGGYDSPALLRQIVPRFPEVAFLCGHSGGGDPGRREAEELAAEFPNVYLEWCGSFCATIPWETTIRAVTPAKVVYGTDAMAHGIHWELGRLLSLDVPDEVLTPILGGNMRRILARRR